MEKLKSQKFLPEKISKTFQVQSMSHSYNNSQETTDEAYTNKTKAID